MSREIYRSILKNAHVNHWLITVGGGGGGGRFFSNSLIIQNLKTKEIMIRDVFGYRTKNSSFLHPFPLQNQFV